MHISPNIHSFCRCSTTFSMRQYHLKIANILVFELNWLKMAMKMRWQIFYRLCYIFFSLILLLWPMFSLLLLSLFRFVFRENKIAFNLISLLFLFLIAYNINRIQITTMKATIESVVFSFTSLCFRVFRLFILHGHRDFDILDREKRNG